MNKKRKRLKKCVILIVIFIIISVILYLFLFKKVIKSSDYIAQIKDYNYTLEKRDTSIMKDNFYALEDVLSKDEIDYEKYAELLAKLYVIDLYTLNNKQSKYDVGASEYIYEDDKSEYLSKVQDTLYNYIALMEDKPEVTKVEVNGNVTKNTFKYQEKDYDSYLVTLSWEYKKDLGYDNYAEIILVNIENKLYIASAMAKVK